MYNTIRCLADSTQIKLKSCSNQSESERSAPTGHSCDTRKSAENAITFICNVDHQGYICIYRQGHSQILTICEVTINETLGKSKLKIFFIYSWFICASHWDFVRSMVYCHKGPTRHASALLTGYPRDMATLNGIETVTVIMAHTISFHICMPG